MLAEATRSAHEELDPPLFPTDAPPSTWVTDSPQTKNHNSNANNLGHNSESMKASKTNQKQFENRLPALPSFPSSSPGLSRTQSSQENLAVSHSQSINHNASLISNIQRPSTPVLQRKWVNQSPTHQGFQTLDSSPLQNTSPNKTKSLSVSQSVPLLNSSQMLKTDFIAKQSGFSSEPFNAFQVSALVQCHPSWSGKTSLPNKNGALRRIVTKPGGPVGGYDTYQPLPSRTHLHKCVV